MDKKKQVQSCEGNSLIASGRFMVPALGRAMVPAFSLIALSYQCSKFHLIIFNTL